MQINEINLLQLPTELTVPRLQQLSQSATNKPLVSTESLDYSTDFVRKLIIIKLNALLKKNTLVTADSINLLTKLAQNPPSSLKKSNCQGDVYRRLFRNCGTTVSAGDLEELSGGCSLILTITHEAAQKTQRIIAASQTAFAVSFQVLNGRINAFLECVHVEKNHAGQITCAKNIRDLLTTTDANGKMECSPLNSYRTQFHKRVQDSYSLRCVPQVHGIAYDLHRNAMQALEQQLNMPQTAHIVIDGKLYPTLSANERLTEQLDFLAMAVNEIASISIVRSERILNDSLNKLPIKIRELPSFKMLEALYWECAALFLKNKALMTPLSSDSINGSNYTIDISYSCLNAFDKVAAVWRSANLIIGLELLIAVRCLEHVRQKDHNERLTPQLEEKVSRAHAALSGEFDGLDEFERALLVYQQSL